jgi:hypothetical protein
MQVLLGPNLPEEEEEKEEEEEEKEEEEGLSSARTGAPDTLSDDVIIDESLFDRFDRCRGSL